MSERQCLPVFLAGLSTLVPALLAATPGANAEAAAGDACSKTTAIYVTDVQRFEILRMAPDGSSSQVIISGVDASDIEVDLAQRKIYWANRDREIMRASLDGSAVEVVHAGLPGSYCLAIDATAKRLYWTNQQGNPKVQSSGLDGGQILDLVPGKADCMIGIAADPLHRALYWMDGYYRGHVVRAHIDGGNPKNIATTVGIANGIAVDPEGGKIYWTEYGNGPEDDVIRKANLDGSSVETLFGSKDGLHTPQHIAGDAAAGKLYWTDLHAGRVQRSNVDGTGLETIRAGLGYPRGIALLIGRIFRPLRFPSAAFFIGRAMGYPLRWLPNQPLEATHARGSPYRDRQPTQTGDGTRSAAAGR